MKKIVLLSSIMLLGVVAMAQNTLHDGRITGVIQMGAKEVVAVHDLQTDCIYKSEPHTKGSFTQGEQVKIDIQGINVEKVQIVKNGINNVNAHSKSCYLTKEALILEKNMSTGEGVFKFIESGAVDNFMFNINKSVLKVGDLVKVIILEGHEPIFEIVNGGPCYTFLVWSCPPGSGGCSAQFENCDPECSSREVTVGCTDNRI